MKTLFSLMIWLCVTSLFSQSVSKQVTASSGASITDGTTKLTTTIGEPIVGKIENNTIISQGFLGKIQSSTFSVETQLNEASIKLYPNPVTEYLSIDFNTIHTDVNLTLYSMEGKEVYRTKFNKQQNKVNLSRLSNGTYLIQLTMPKTQQTKSFKIIKK